MRFPYYHPCMANFPTNALRFQAQELPNAPPPTPIGTPVVPVSMLGRPNNDDIPVVFLSIKERLPSATGCDLHQPEAHGYYVGSGMRVAMCLVRVLGAIFKYAWKFGERNLSLPWGSSWGRRMMGIAPWVEPEDRVREGDDDGSDDDMDEGGGAVEEVSQQEARNVGEGGESGGDQNGENDDGNSGGDEGEGEGEDEGEDDDGNSGGEEGDEDEEEDGGEKEEVNNEGEEMQVGQEGCGKNGKGKDRSGKGEDKDCEKMEEEDDEKEEDMDLD